MSAAITKTNRTSSGTELVLDIGGIVGHPVVFLAHGGGQTRHSWAKAFHALIDSGYRVVNYDALGHGESGWHPTGNYSVVSRYKDLLGLTREEADGVPYAVVGASMGGSTALYGVGEDLLPDALVLVDIAPNASKIGTQRVIDFMRSGVRGFDRLEDVLVALQDYNPSRGKSGSTAGLSRNLRTGKDGRLYWHWDPRFVDMDVRQERELLRNSLHSMQLSDIPTLLVRGKQSDVVTQQVMEGFTKVFPHVEIAEIGGAGHMVAGDKNDAFNEAMVSFLLKHMPPEKK